MLRGCAIVFAILIGFGILVELLSGGDDAAEGPPDAVATGPTFSKYGAKVDCDNRVRDAAKSKSKFDANFEPTYTDNQPNPKYMTIQNEFDSQNSFGATLTGQYICVVAKADGSIASLHVRDGGEWYHLAGADDPLKLP